MAHLVPQESGPDPRALLMGYGHSASDELERIQSGIFDEDELAGLEAELEALEWRTPGAWR